MNMGSRYEVPQDIFEELQDEKKTLNINFNDFSCVIDGSELGDSLEDFNGLDVGFSMEKDEGLSADFEGKDAFQLHFNHSGALPCPLIYKVKVEGYSPGDELYLYYKYDSSGVIEAKQKVVVNSEGYITFQIYHCSSYVLTDEVIEGAVNNYGLAAVDASIVEAAQTPTPAPSPTQEPTEEPSPSPTPVSAESESDSATEDDAPTEGIPHPIYILSLFGIALITGAITVLVMKKKGKKNPYKRRMAKKLDSSKNDKK
jgi:hypothetical protein